MIDTTIRFNDHNSFKVTSNLLCYPFGVDGMDYITHSFQVYSTSMLASATRTKTKFLDANGATISDVSHAFAVTTVFGKVEITVAVPATAVQAQLVLIQGGTNWWLAEPKSEQGQVATPYNVNYAGQMTYITPNGLYTGMVTANQIVVTGSVGQPDETLGTRLVTINNNVINLSSTVNNHETRVTTIEAGQITLTNTVNSKVGVGVNYKGVTIDATNGFTSTATVGGKTIVTKANSIDGLSIYNGSTKVFGVDTSGRVFTQSISNLEDSSWYATMGVIGTGSSEQGLVLYSRTTPKYLQITESSGSVIFLDRNLKNRIVLGTNGTVLYDSSGNNRFHADNSSTILRDSSGTARFYSDNDVTIINDSNNINRIALGVNSTVLRDGSGTNRFLADNTVTILRENSGTNRFYADSSLTILTDSNNIHRFEAGGVLTAIKDSSGTNRFYSSTSSTSIRSPDDKTYVLVTNSGISIVVNGVTKASW